MINAPDFQPPWLLRNPQLQSVLATKSPRKRQWRRRGCRMEAVAMYHELDAGNDVRLTGYLSQQAGVEREARGLVVLIHGWEGSHDSTYLYSMACALFDAGYSVFRLNLRDHGGTHHLNREVFHSARIDEVLGAIRVVQAMDQTQPMFVIGFSLGGNFALRVGLYGSSAGVTPRLTVGICPSINPRSTIDAIDHGSRLFRWYFMDKWRKTVEAKVTAWPEYATAAKNYLRLDNLLDITARFAEEQTEYGALQPYLDAYTLTPEMLLQAPSPLAIITAADDPVIPLDDFSGLSAERALRHFEVTRHGGHCGFIENVGLQSWAETRVLAMFEQALSPGI
ncbi:alpha/beta fold hydrolase [Sinimarinibacterium sp. CAU 1509]|uniref:YheT family hydrolase n=1 Tax=Sinimarinibacterium sp. CAU 1509 TaxID=2562283 RepID=UPI0010AB7CD1|nr:alpha/beta fold hydrolase [Sinimarinibacterium sp. CAU 1509]TJY62077.1 alpha/beta fold hydrolase [Sinimarinibacterium sp. CAU 1509]